MTASTEPEELPAWIDATVAATQRYLEDLTVLSDADVRAPSLLPGWSRAHVLTHVARNADGLRNLLVWARTGVETPQYPSWEQRNLDIDSGSRRPISELRDDSHQSGERFLDEVSRLRGDDWEQPVRTLKSRTTFPARDVLTARRTEVEVHHADLGLGYSAADWPEDFARLLVGRIRLDRADGPSMVLVATDGEGRWTFGTGAGPEVTGPLADLAWWLSGRGNGSGLLSSTGELPQLGKWR
jgi:maleylpyruvate isomerase